MNHKRNWKQFFLNSLKSKLPITRDNLYINEKKQSNLNSPKSAGKIQIISPTAQATSQARESAKSNIFKENQVQRVQRKIRKPRIKKGKNKKITKKSKSKPKKKSIIPQRKYK